MSTSEQPGFRRPAGRYGPDRSERSRTTTVVLGVLLALFIGAIASVGWRLSNPEITVTVRAYDVIDDQNVEVTYLIRRADGANALTCVLRARDRSGNEVGRLTVAVPPGEREVIRTDRLATTARANLGEVQQCSLA